MDFEIVSRHMEMTPATRDFVAKRAEKLQKFFDRIHALKVIITADGANYQVEFVAHLVKKNMVIAKDGAGDLFTAIDATADKLENELRRYKEKLRGHRTKGDEKAPAEGAE